MSFLLRSDLPGGNEDEVCAKGMNPDRPPRTEYMRFTSEVLPVPANPRSRMVMTGGMSVSSFAIPPAGNHRSPAL